MCRSQAVENPAGGRLPFITSSWGQAFLNDDLCAIAASLGEKQQRLVISEGVAGVLDPSPSSQVSELPLPGRGASARFRIFRKLSCSSCGVGVKL